MRFFYIIVSIFLINACDDQLINNQTEELVQKPQVDYLIIDNAKIENMVMLSVIQHTPILSWSIDQSITQFLHSKCQYFNVDRYFDILVNHHNMSSYEDLKGHKWYRWDNEQYKKAAINAYMTENGLISCH